MKVNHIHRYLNLLDYAIISFKRKWLKNLGVFFVFLITVFILASFQLFSTSVQHLTTVLLYHVPDITVQQMSAGRQVSLEVNAEEKLDGIFGIKNIRQRVWGYYFNESNGANYTVVGLGFADVPEDLVDLGLQQGVFPKPGERGKVVIGDGVLKNLQLGERKFFSLFTPTLNQIAFQRTGVFSDDLSLLTSDLILMDIDDARELFGIDENHITDLLINSANPNEIQNMASIISKKIAGARVVTKEQMSKTYKAAFGWRSGVGSIALLGGLIAFMILAWDKASGMSQEEKRETAILKSIGWQTNDVMLVRFFESLILSVTAFVIGYILAWYHIVWFDGFVFRPLMLGWSILQPSYNLIPIFKVEDFILISSLTIIPYWCATVVPLWRSSIILPDKVK